MNLPYDLKGEILNEFGIDFLGKITRQAHLKWVSKKGPRVSTYTAVPTKSNGEYMWLIHEKWVEKNAERAGTSHNLVKFFDGLYMYSEGDPLPPKKNLFWVILSVLSIVYIIWSF